jgi:hypothetical protein
MDKLLQYGLVNSENILINTVVVSENDTEALENAKTEIGASAYYLIDTEVYLVRINALKWNGTYWDKNPNYDPILEINNN